MKLIRFWLFEHHPDQHLAHTADLSRKLLFLLSRSTFNTHAELTVHR